MRSQRALIMILVAGCTTPVPHYSFPAPPEIPQETRPIDIASVLPNHEGLTPERLGKVLKDLKEQAAAARMQAEVYDQIREIYAKCIPAGDAHHDAINKAADKNTKTKTVSGAITGGLTALFGGAAGVSNAVADQTSKSSAPTWLGGASAIIGLAGTIITAVISPGDAELKSHSERAQRIKDHLEAVKQFIAEHGDPGAWTSGVKADWAKLLGETDGKCK